MNRTTLVYVVPRYVTIFDSLDSGRLSRLLVVFDPTSH